VVEYVEHKSAAVEEFVNDKIEPLATKAYVTQALDEQSSGGGGGLPGIHVYSADEALTDVNSIVDMSRTVITVVGDMVQVGLCMKGKNSTTLTWGSTFAKLPTTRPMPYANLPVDSANEMGIDLAARGFMVQTSFELNKNQVQCHTFNYMGDPSTVTVPE
jgi:hypothetical protein